MTRSETPSLKPQILSRTDTCWPLQSSHKAQGARFLAYRIPTTSGDSLARGCSSPRSGGSAEALTEARGGDGVHVDLVVADFLVALFVGGWLGEGRALVAMAPGDLVHALHHSGLQALPTGRRALPETGRAELGLRGFDDATPGSGPCMSFLSARNNHSSRGLGCIPVARRKTLSRCYRLHVWVLSTSKYLMPLCVLVAQFCLILCVPMDCSPPGSFVHGILQARKLDGLAISFSRGSSQSRD